MTFVIDNLAVSNYLYSPAGPVSLYVGAYAATEILPLSQATISRPWPGGKGPFPPPGPPYRREKDKVFPDLHDSLTVREVTTSVGTEFHIVPTAIKRSYNYGEILQRRGYRFLPDSYYL